MQFLLSKFNSAKHLLGLDLSKHVIWRRNKSFRSGAPTSSAIRVGIVGSGSLGDPASVYVKTCDHSTSIFNCGEGTFRLLYSKWFRFKFIGNVFCTRKNWQCVGGIPSVGRAIFDKNSQFPTIHGPHELADCIDQFAALTDLDPEDTITSHQFNTENYFEDSNITVEFVRLFPTSANSKENEVYAYLCRLKPRRGRFKLNRLTDKNLTVTHVQNLTKGNSITLDDGRVINPQDVQTAGFLGGNFLIIDIPSTDFLESLSQNEQLTSYLKQINESECGMEFVIHFTSPSIINTPEYQAFIKRSNAKRHFAVNQCNEFSSFRRAHRLQNCLNTLDSDIFPVLSTKCDEKTTTYTNLDVTNSNRNEVCVEQVSGNTEYIFIARAGDQANVKEDSDETSDDTDTDSDEAKLNEAIGHQPRNVIENSNSSYRQSVFPKVVFFGTGSSFPGPTRSVTSILVQTSSDTSILLDCGEGAAGQMIRFYGDRSADIIRSIKAVFISHMHGDHHVGFMDLLHTRRTLMPFDRPPLLLMAPKSDFKQLLDFYDEHFGDVHSEYTIIDNDDLISSSLSEDQKKLLNVSELQTCRVPHMERSFAISVTSKSMPAAANDFKLTFSGDTLPCDELVELGRDSTLLIHEATLEDTLMVSAAQKKHSTFSQAVEQGQKMNAKYTILTHFSQRYPILPSIELDQNIGIAFDNMEVIESDLCKLYNFYPKLKEMFKNEIDKVEARSKRYKSRFDLLA